MAIETVTTSVSTCSNCGKTVDDEFPLSIGSVGLGSAFGGNGATVFTHEGCEREAFEELLAQWRTMPRGLRVRIAAVKTRKRG